MPRVRNHYERRLQIFLVRQFRRIVDPLDASLVSIENGEDRPDKTLELLHALGVEDGFPDLALIMIRRRVVWIEVKLEATLRHPRTELRLDQASWHELLQFYGFRTEVVRSWNELLAILDEEKIPHRPSAPSAEQGLLWSVESRKRASAPG